MVLVNPQYLAICAHGLLERTGFDRPDIQLGLGILHQDRDVIRHDAHTASQMLGRLFPVSLVVHFRAQLQGLNGPAAAVPLPQGIGGSAKHAQGQE
ncbi:MAG: hypothetical protein BWY71_02061 [Planctomycetes bacterium ADurb.Bin412]|nr:MAG: hypothetical protein BWY71_02061 [Planctomycetes bacterium ADurb.Bin412]